MPEIDTYLLLGASFIVSFIITYFSIPSIIKVSRYKHLYDEPDNRTVHTANVPTLGGMAIFAGISFSSLIFVDTFQFPEFKYVLAAMIVMFFIGIKDDILIIAPLTKLSGQILAAGIISILADIRFSNLHGFFGITEIPYWISIAMTIFVIIVIINGFNLIDGVDGLCGSIVIITSTTLGVWFYFTGFFYFSIISIVIVGAVLAFLRFNVFSKKDKIFLGDTGSLILGLLISVQIIEFNEINIRHNFEYAIYGAPAVSFAILIVPLFDTLRVMFIRFFLKRPIFKPDKQHIHHLFLRLGLNHFLTVFIISVINILFIIAGFYMHNLVGIRTIALIMILSAMIIFYIPHLISQRRKRKTDE